MSTSLIILDWLTANENIIRSEYILSDDNVQLINIEDTDVEFSCYK